MTGDLRYSMQHLTPDQIRELEVSFFSRTRTPATETDLVHFLTLNFPDAEIEIVHETDKQPFQIAVSSYDSDRRLKGKALIRRYSGMSFFTVTPLISGATLTRRFEDTHSNHLEYLVLSQVVETVGYTINCDTQGMLTFLEKYAAARSRTRF